MLTKLVIASGFGQHEGLWNGNLELKEILKQEFDSCGRREVDIQLYPWNSNWQWVARQFHLERLRYQLTYSQYQVVVFAYSWGVGNGLVKLAKALNQYGIGIRCAVVCDGIYRHPYPGGEWRAYFGDWFNARFSQITLPTRRDGSPIIERVKAFYQRRTRPMGQVPITKAPLEWTELYYPHVDMDDAPEWHLECVKTAKAYIQRKPLIDTGARAAKPATAETLESQVVVGDMIAAQGTDVPPTGTHYTGTH